VKVPELTTSRLRLRAWSATDRSPFAALNADAAVMEFLPSVLPPDESNAMADRIVGHFERHGFGLWAVEIPGVTAFAGFIGLNVPIFDAPFMPCVEIGWRLAANCWGHGFAREGAAAALKWALDRMPEVVSFTVPGNLRSRRVMEVLGMKQDLAGDFEHPMLAVGHRLRSHVLYRSARGLSA
jgi:RimJ/RimL family protein N-acetyltransferase